ncbi:hypothetical protein JL722_6330 [Aureococcus anophagefferens]|nr:hypothetical protein JL722_6330 [Aureococcus anophagefferens]
MLALGRASRRAALVRPLASGPTVADGVLKSVPVALTTLDYVGTVAFAASGTMVAGQAGMDVLGCCFVGTVTSLGGGTIRDLLLGRTPVFWFKDTSYLLLCLGTALATFFARDSLEEAGLLDDEVLWWGDTLGIGAFSVVGAQAAAGVGMHPVVTALCGMFTATRGSCTARKPRRRRRRARSRGARGASLFTLLSRVGAPAPAAVALGGACTIAVRLYGSVFNVKLPTYVLADDAPAPRLDPVDAHLFVTAYAPDRIGHVAALTKCLADARANISASKILTIGDDLAFMMVVSAPHAARGDLAERVKAAGHAKGMVVQTHDITPSQAARAASKQSASPKFTARVSLQGPDSPGLVHNLTALLRDHGLNITALDSRVFERSRLGRRDTPADETARSLAHRKATDTTSPPSSQNDALYESPEIDDGSPIAPLVGFHRMLELADNRRRRRLWELGAKRTLARHARVLSAQRVAPMSSLVLSIVGPDRTGLVSEVTQIVAGRGGNVTESHSFNIGPVYSMAMMVDVGADQHSELVAAVTAAVPSYAVSAHDGSADVEAASSFAAAVEVSCADGVGLIAKVTEFIAESGLSLSKLSTKSEGAPHGGAQLFSLKGVMLSSGPVDEDKLAQGFRDLENEMGLAIEYCKYDDDVKIAA